MPQRGAGGGLGDRRQVIRQPHQQHGVDNGRRSDQVTEAAAGERERLAHGPGDDQLGRVFVDQLDRAGLRRELAVRLVEDENAGGHRVEQPAQVAERDALARRVIRAGDEHHVGAALGDRRDGDVYVKAEVVGAVGHQPLGLSAAGDDRVHRIGRHEAERAAARPAERLQQLLQDFVRTVGGPEVFDAERGSGLRGQVRGQVGAQRHRVAVGVAVQIGGGVADGSGDIVDECRSRRVRVLVRVESHRDGQLWCAVGRFAAQVLAQRQIGQRHALTGGLAHFSNLRRTASPCEGRFSACARVMT